MANLTFVSPGALGGNAIAQFLMQRALAERQRQQDEFKRQQAEIENQRQAQALALQQQQEARIAEAQQQAMQETARQHEATRAANIYQTQLPGVIDQATLDFEKKYGYQLPVTQGQPTQGAYQGEDAAGVPQYDVIPGVLQTTGGFQYQQSRAAEQARAADAAANREAANQRATEANATREEIARMGATGQEETRGLRNQLTQMQIDEKQQKLATAQAADKAKADAATQYGNEITTLVNDLLDPSGNLKPEVSHIVGPISGRTGAWTGDQQTALEKINRLVSLLDIGKLREMKAQSPTGATGFGALSEKELGVLEAAGSTLRNRLQGEANYAAELARIKQAMGGGAAATTTAKPLTARELIDKYSR